MTIQRVISGHVAFYDVIVTPVSVVVLDERDKDHIRAKQQVDLGSFLATAEDIRLGWAEFPDFEVIYVYDRADQNFGYAVNLDDPDLSEWGYAPFGAGEEEMLE